MYSASLERYLENFAARQFVIVQCDSGVQTETRNVFVKPINGGEACDALDDSRPCNTESCDRDCTYHDWTDWSSCSMSCSMEGYTGQQTRVRHIDVPLRANGKCA